MTCRARAAFDPGRRVASITDYRASLPVVDPDEPLGSPVAYDTDPGWRVSDMIVSGLTVLFAGFVLIACTGILVHWGFEALDHEAIQAMQVRAVMR